MLTIPVQRRPMIRRGPLFSDLTIANLKSRTFSNEVRGSHNLFIDKRIVRLKRATLCVQELRHHGSRKQLPSLNLRNNLGC